MKKTLLFVSLFAFGLSFGQNCSDLFISEYVEGWSNNKAIEIYNPTNQTVDLGGYVIARASNGSSIGAVTVEYAMQLSGSIAPYDVYVGVLDKRDPNGTGLEAPIWDSLEVRGDGFYAPDYSTNKSFYWNGNDAIILFKGSIAGAANSTLLTSLNLTVVDIFGKVGENPGPDTGWSTVFPYSTGLGEIVTVDHSMIRKATVMKGETNLNISFFDPLNEYDSIPAVTYLTDDNGDTLESGNGNPILFGNWFTLGAHDCDCKSLSVSKKDAVKTTLSVYPNPSSNGMFYIESSLAIESISIYNSLGQLIRTQEIDSTKTPVKISDLPGVYIMKIKTSTDGVVTKRLIVK